MFRDFGSAPAGSRIRRGATEEREAAGIARQDADMDLSVAPPGHHPAWHIGFAGGSSCIWGFRIEPRQIALIGTIRGIGRVLPDPIRAHRRAFIQNAPLKARQRATNGGVFLCRSWWRFLANSTPRASICICINRASIPARQPEKAMFQMMGVFAEFQRAMIVERVKAGLSRARSQGKRLGRRPVGEDVVERIREQL
jgi:hypothetical protein